MVPSASIFSIALSRAMERLMVAKFVSVPPSHRSTTKNWPLSLAVSLIAVCACFFVPTNSTFPPFLTEAARKSHAAVQVTPDRMTAIRMAIRDQYPTLPVITSRDIAEMLAVLSSDALALVRAVAWYAIAAGLCILVAAVAASRQARSSEIGILSALGARRATLLKMYTLEFAAIGVLSSAIAGLLACGFASVVMSVIFQRLEIVLEWKPIAAALAGAALLTVVAGWLPVYGFFGGQPKGGPI